MLRWRPNMNRMFIGRNTVKQSLVWCAPFKTHLSNRSTLGISSGYSLECSPTTGLHCCVLTHRPVKDRAFNLSGVLQWPGSLEDPKEGDGLCSGHIPSVSVGTGPLRGMDPHLWQQKILGQPFPEQLHGSHGSVKITPSSMSRIVVEGTGWMAVPTHEKPQGTLSWGC